MCGIAGFAGLQDRELLEAMTQTLRHRGPDDSGFFHEQGVGLGSRRLAVIDLEAGPQPVKSEDGGVVVVFNGEIYNFRELRTELENKGHIFKTRTDTEVIAHLYEEAGPKALERLSGMFAVAIWDAKRETLILARDPLGVKPLYYAVRGASLYFGSELKALLAAPDIPREIDLTSLGQYLDNLYVGAPATIYKGIRKLRPGEALTWEAGRISTRVFWTPVPSLISPSRNEALTELDGLMRKIIDDQTVADVPVGLFLSGGLDSSALAYYLAQGARRPDAFCAHFSTGGDDYNEVEKARVVASHFGYKLNELRIEPDIEGVLDAMVEAFDEPLADSSALPTYWISKLARATVTVALTGIGGDEVFGGYPRYLGAKLLPAYQALPAAARAALARAAGAIPDQMSSRNIGSWLRRFIENGPAGAEGAYAAWMGHLSPADKSTLFGSELLQAHRPGEALKRAFDLCEGDFLKRVQAVDLRTYLPEDLLTLADRASMASSLELRVPLCDQRLVEFLVGLPADFQVRGMTLKPLLKDLLAGKLPKAILAQKKQGFMIPLGIWFKSELKPLVERSIAGLETRGLFHAAGLDKIWQEHLSGKRNRTDVIWSWILLERWLQRWAPEFRAGHAPSPAASRGGPRSRVLHLVTRLDVGGSAENVVLSSQGSQKDGFDAAIASGPSRDLTEAARGVEVLVVPSLKRAISPLNDARAFLEILSLLRAWRPDVLHTHSSKAGLLGRWAAWVLRRLGGGPKLVVHTPHGHVFYGYFGPLKNTLFLWLERLSAHACDGLVALTEGEMRDHLALGVGREEQWTVVPSGVALPVDTAAADRDGIPGDALIIGCVARLEPVKGIAVLLEAAALLLPKVKRPVRLLIVGDGPEAQDLKMLAAQLGIGDRVVFAGYQPEPLRLMKAMDIYVQPSLNEGMGKTLVMAQALGLAVAASRVCGIPSVVKDGETGLLTAPGDANELAEILGKLVDEPELRKRLGAAAKRWIASPDETGARSFSVESMVLRLDKLYRRGLAALGLIIALCVTSNALTLRAVAHVHSGISHSGTEDLAKIAESAAAKGIDVFIPTDTFVADWEYGLWPLRGLISKKVTQKSVLTAGIGAYLAKIKEVRRQFPNLVVIPGVEAAAYYRWEGLPWRGLTIHDWNRHLLIVGLEDAGAYARLPAAGNAQGGRFDLFLLWPLATLALGWLGWTATRRRRFAMIVVLSAVFLADGWPYRSPADSAYAAQTSWAPYQNLIDYARGAGALVLWAHPDATNWNDVNAGGKVSVKTDPYPESLLRTVGYDGFCALNEGMRGAGSAGGTWDQALSLYLNGERERPVWAAAELDYRSAKDTPIDLDQMIIDTPSRSQKDILASLAKGRFYSVEVATHRLVLKRWSLTTRAGSAGSGETLAGAGSPKLEVELAYDDGSTGGVDLQIIEGGRVVNDEQVSVPGHWTFNFDDAPAKTFYRAVVRGASNNMLITNPIFAINKS